MARVNPDPAQSETVAAGIGRIAQLSQQQQHAQALAATRLLASRFPDHRDVLYLLVINLQRRNAFREALDVLERAQRLFPGFSRLYQERGRCLAALGDHTAAIAAFRQAVTLNPALPVSWQMLHRLYRSVGHTSQAEEAARQLAAFAGQAPEVLQATSFLVDGELLLAHNIIQGYLQGHPGDLAATRVLARILLARQQFAASLAVLAPALEAHPADAELRLLNADTSAALGDIDTAIRQYRALQPSAPAVMRADLHIVLAHALRTAGQEQEAAREYRAAAASRPAHGAAWWNLSNLKTWRFPQADIEQMRTQEALATTPVADRYPLCFALGKALEDEGDYPGSWQYYQRGNALKRSTLNYSPQLVDQRAHLHQSTATADWFAARKDWGVAAADPIFIVGLPRSGSTLIEQILASHSKVEGTRELMEIGAYAHELRGQGGKDYPECLSVLPASAFQQLGARFLAETRSYRHSNRPFFIDKMPNNFWHLGLIQLMLPNARIIDARREPMACGFSNFKQLFAGGQEFSYDLSLIGHHYRAYLALMRHWQRVLPGRVLTVQYEDLVQDLEGGVRRIMEYCGLEFEPACLAFHETRRIVQTPSSLQVRRPLNRDGLEQWRHYEPWLAPLKDALGDALSHYRD